MGFFGKSWWGPHFSGVAEFGIITAPKDLALPDVVYDMEELKNTDGGQDVRPAAMRRDSTDCCTAHQVRGSVSPWP